MTLAIINKEGKSINKKAAKEFYDVRNVGYGLQEKKVNQTRIFIAPSTSGAANGFWDINQWISLAKLVDKS